jgi:hypothetical protein
MNYRVSSMPLLLVLMAATTLLYLALCTVLGVSSSEEKAHFRDYLRLSRKSAA